MTPIRTAIRVEGIVQGVGFRPYVYALATGLGLGGFVGNVVMGVIFCWLYSRWRRVAPLAIEHTPIDTVAFVGYVLLAGHVSWLPT